ATGGVDVASHHAAGWREDYATAYPDAQPWARGQVRDFSDEELGAIDIPVLLIWAKRDPLSPLPVAQRLASKIPNATLVTFESDDHWFIHQFADPVARLVARYQPESADAP